MDFDLSKKVEAFTFNLEKKGITKAPIMRVWFATDISGSMDDELRDGKVQVVLDQFGAVAIKFDDNGELDVIKFDDRADYVGTWKESDFGTAWLRRNGVTARGGTAYSPFINMIVGRCFTNQPVPTKLVPQQVEKSGFLGFGKKTVTEMVEVPDTSAAPKQEPVLVLVNTDGDPVHDNATAIHRALTHALGYPIFFAFIGMSNQRVSFTTLKNLDRDFKNVGFIEMKFGQSDDALYDQLITPKLVDFLKQF